MYAPAPRPIIEQHEATVVVATRHRAIRSALWAVLDVASGVCPIGATGDLLQTTMLLHYLQPDAVLVDPSIVGGPGLEHLGTLRAAAPDAALIVVGMGDHPAYAAHARAAGACDYVKLDDAAERVPETIRAATAAGRARPAGGAPVRM